MPAQNKLLYKINHLVGAIPASLHSSSLINGLIGLDYAHPGQDMILKCPVHNLGLLPSRQARTLSEEHGQRRYRMPSGLFPSAHASRLR